MCFNGALSLTYSVTLAKALCLKPQSSFKICIAQLLPEHPWQGLQVNGGLQMYEWYPPELCGIQPARMYVEFLGGLA